jgi:peptidoglycan/LPS O-acetylase OafA/YrhL
VSTVVTREPLAVPHATTAPPRPASRPAWLPAFIPAFDGLRGIAIVAVLLYHCHTRLQGTSLERFVIWGWTGVSLFFVLSGFLITGIILDARPGPGFYANFFRRRALRIWPAYWLLLFLFYFFFPFVFSGHRWMLHEIAHAPWLYLLLFLQNLRPLALPGTLGPTWSLAIEQQFYVFWAPIARQLPPRWLLVASAAMLALSPAVRLYYGDHLTPIHTLIHLDGLALGAMIAIGLRVFDWSPAVWRWIARAALAVGASGVWLMLHRGSAFTDSLLAVGFGAMLLYALLPPDRDAGQARFWLAAVQQPNSPLAGPPAAHALPPASLYCRAMGFGPLAFVGKISYGLYLIHILVFSLMGGYVDKHLDRFGMAGNLAIVAIRLTVAIACAALMWRYFEQPILARKK